MRHKLKYILDACALLAQIKKEPGADIVDDLVKQGEAGEIELFINTVQLLEVYYDRRRVKGIEDAEEFLEWAYASPLHIVDFTTALIHEAGRLKTSYSMSLGDAIACATAIDLSATLVTKDGEITTVEQREKLSVRWIK
jgi:PIN domain nuclease of toxin-antitoxin system